VTRAPGAAARAGENARRAHREPDVDQRLAELDQAPEVARRVPPVVAAVEERLRQPPERIGDEATDEQDEERPRPAVVREDAEGALRIGRLAAVAEGELEREGGDGREADPLGGEPDASEPADPLAARRAACCSIRTGQRVRFLTSLRALPAACCTLPFAAVAAPFASVFPLPVS